MKTLVLKFIIALSLMLSAIGPTILAKNYWQEHQLYGMDTLDQYATCLMIATALLVSGFWFFILAIFTEDDN